MTTAHSVPHAAVCCAGFLFLPTVLQEKILTLHLEAEQRSDAEPRERAARGGPVVEDRVTGAVRDVCRSFDAVHFLFYRARRHLLIDFSEPAADLRYSLPLLYSPQLASLTCTFPSLDQIGEHDGSESDFLWAILDMYPMPHLAAVTLESLHHADLGAALAALDHIAQQLTHLVIDVDGKALIEADLTEPIDVGSTLDLPPLPLLRQLTLHQPLDIPWRMPGPCALVGLANLSAMAQLTRLSLSSEAWHSDYSDNDMLVVPVC